MFVMNCAVKSDEVLRYQTQTGRKQRNRKRRKAAAEEAEAEAAPEGMEAGEAYHPVCCSECSTEVAVLDRDEVFHFFNVLASHC